MIVIECKKIFKEEMLLIDMVEQFLQAVEESLRGSPSYHQKLVLDGFEPKWYIPLHELLEFKLNDFKRDLAKIVLIPGDLVPETLPSMHNKNPEQVYVAYVKPR